MRIIKQSVRHFFSDAMTRTVLDTLARRLPQKDREQLAQRWGLSSSTPSNTKPPLPPVTPPVPTPPPVNPTVSIQPPQLTEYKAKELMHPLFGELVADLGYKRVYVTNVLALASAPIWEKNRILRPERARKIANSKASDKSNPGLPGVITCFFEPETKRCGIVDGQHRAAALVLMVQDGIWDEMKRNVLVDVFDVKNDAQVAALFKEINSSEPVKLVDMPEDGASEGVREMLSEAAEALQGRYPEMFKPSSRCRVPHLHADTLRDELFQADFIARRKVKTTVQLVEVLEKVNVELAARSDAAWTTGDKAASATALAKCRTHNFFLGLDKAWMH